MPKPGRLWGDLNSDPPLTWGGGYLIQRGSIRTLPNSVTSGRHLTGRGVNMPKQSWGFPGRRHRRKAWGGGQHSVLAGKQGWHLGLPRRPSGEDFTFPCRDCGFDPHSGSQDPTRFAAKKSKLVHIKKNTKLKKKINPNRKQGAARGHMGSEREKAACGPRGCDEGS